MPSALASLVPQIEWNEAENFLYADGNPYIGPAAVAEGVFQRLGGEWEYWKLDIEELPAADGIFVARGRYNAVNKKTGKQIKPRFAHLWWLRDGKAVRFQQYADTAQVAAAVGS